jgi:hypothetical protein
MAIVKLAGSASAWQPSMRLPSDPLMPLLAAEFFLFQKQALKRCKF